MTKPGERVLCFPGSGNLPNGIQVFGKRVGPVSREAEGTSMGTSVGRAGPDGTTKATSTAAGVGPARRQQRAAHAGLGEAAPQVGVRAQAGGIQ